MRIAVYHDLPSGGAKRALHEIVRRLAPRHAIDVYTLSSANADFGDLRPYAAEHRVFEFEPLPLFRSPLGRLNQLQRWRDLRRLDEVARQAAAEMGRRGYEVVYAHHSQWTQAPQVLEHLRQPSVYHMHEGLRRAYEPPIPRPYFKRSWRSAADRLDPLVRLYHNTLIEVDRRNTRRAMRLLANSRYTAANVERIYGRQAAVCYSCVDVEVFRPLPGVTPQNFVLSVGALRPDKGFDFLIESLARLPTATRPPLRIVGNASDEQERAYLTGLAVRHNVVLEIETMVSEATLVQRYNEAALLIYAPVREPLGLAPLEAMACGRPVVGVAEGGVPETVADGVTGRLARRDPAEFARAVAALLEDARLRETFGWNGREHVVRQWTWEATVERVEQNLCEAVSTGTKAS